MYEYKMFTAGDFFSLILTCTTCLFTPAVMAGTFPGFNEELYTADAYLLERENPLSQGALNCATNDVQITQVILVNENEECIPGEMTIN